MVWIVKYDDMNGGDQTITVWDNKDSAYMDACAMIINDINSSWDFSDPVSLAVAQDIENFIQHHQWSEAICCWNDWSSNYDFCIYWTVSEETLYSSADAATPTHIIWPTQNNDASDALTNEPFIATVPGATCRGCHNWNEYAYADNIDGTFVCYSCKII